LSASPPAVELRAVSRHFGTVEAVRSLDLAIVDGEFFSLLGPSGCGKTTTLRLIAGFETPSSGQILIQGKEVQHLPPYRRNVNTAFQSYALFPHLNVFENIAFGLRRKGVASAEIAEKVAWSLRLVQLEGFEKRRTPQLSGGEQQRVAMARALVNTPALLLLDEPLSALDEKLRKHMQLELKRIQREIGVTFVLVTHDQEEALTLSDRIAVMNRGRIEQVGTPAEIYERPTTRFVTEFVGASNFFRGTVVGREGEDLVVRLAEGAAVRVPGPGEGDVEFFVRPEKMWLSIAPSGGDNGLAGVLRSVIYQGPATRFEVEVGERTITVSVMNLRPPEGMAVGSEVWIHWQPGSGRLMCGADGAATNC
jgi:spermidine/putrescine transport system ATP-binding protein